MTDLNDTWTWDGKDWRQIQGGSVPPWREDAVFVYDDASSVVLWFGGMTSGGVGDTWTFDGKHWTQRHSTSGPSARFGAVAAYDPVGRQVIMFGGSKLAETWSWADGEWRQQQPATSPSATSYWSDLLFDPTKNRLTLFGGHLVGDSWVSEIWAWENSNWSQVPAAMQSPWYYTPPYGLDEEPPLRASILYTDVDAGVIKSIAFHQARSAAATPLAQSWNGSSWVGDHEIAWAPTTAGGSYTYFPLKRHLLTFGGDTCELTNQDILEDDQTWNWAGNDWLQLHPQTNPPARSTTYLAYAAAQGKVVMFGGYVRGGCGLI